MTISRSDPDKKTEPERLSGVPDSHEGDIMNWLYSEHRIYGEQGHQIARALISGRVPHVKYVAETGEVRR